MNESQTICAEVNSSMSGKVRESVQSLALREKRFWPHDLILGLLPLILCAQAFIAAAQLPQTVRGIADFRQLYAGGYMVRTGHAAELYDYEAQRNFEDKIAPLEKSLIFPINHLAFEEVLFVPFSFFSYRTAFWLFFVFNCGLLVVCIRLLRFRLQVLSCRWIWFPPLLFGAFYPIGRTLVEGQDSILTLTLLAGALFALDQGWEFAAGILVGAGLYKFQIVVPIALLYLIWRRWRFCWGFALSSTVAGLVSLWFVGFHGAVQYAQTMSDMSMRLTSNEAMIRYETFPLHMLNLRSVVAGTLEPVMPHWACLLVIVVSSVLVLWAAAKRGPSMPIAITAAALVSYHFLLHDASILIIPVIAALSCGSVALGTSVVVFLLISMVTSAVRTWGYVVALVVLVFFVLMIRTDKESSKAALA
ncbi:MAG TPA: glycosyltransferase family 87 protein [Candidatus Sulfotelmatobacter sp.]|nr:glycosyltransferase family 87 protein [Candidatus Sulfotelmatobacter sp.]